MLLEKMQLFARKSLFYPQINFGNLEKVVCSNLRRFCNSQTEINNITEQQPQNQQPSETPKTETESQETTPQISNEQPQISLSQESTPIGDSQQQQQPQQQLQQKEKNKKQSEQIKNRFPQTRVQQGYSRINQSNRRQKFQQYGGNSDGNWQQVLRVEGVTQYALRQDLQELFSAFGVDVSDENFVPEFQAPSFGVRRWWVLVTQEQKDKILKAKSGEHFRLV
eukprot:TRINITY_DN12884_c1_g1_i2.p1 TRINITY_DN12884_c1_g1~~TRINITY_DN12884_c1_g1_i2.p1  ORF type:complete len:223 (+),score=30.49 TRINITY_DN12884_c1_g1_i2:190-858(+)